MNINIMSELTLHKISYKDLKEFNYKSFDDPYSILAFMTNHLRETLLACPNNVDENKTAMYVMTDGNVAVGRLLEFETKIVIDGIIVPTQTGSSLFVEESYRPQGVGVDLLMAQKTSKDYDVKIGSLFSTMVVPMIKKLGYALIDIPQFASIRDTRPLIESYGIHGFLQTICTIVANLPIRSLDAINYIRRRRLLKQFDIKKESTVPDWAGEMVMNDPHKYKEFHNQEWLQWNLDYNMNGFPGDKQSFFSVWNNKGEPIGFFMTKERFEKEVGRYRNIIRGTIVEWATVDESVLSESDLNLLALNTFSTNTYIVLTVTSNVNTEKGLKRMGFRNHGILQMNIYDKKKKYPGIYNKDSWRLRYGCGNTIIFGN